MAASKFALGTFALFAALAAPAISANDDVLRMLGRDVTVKTARLDTALRECERKEKSAALPVFTAKKTAALGLTRDELVLATGYLSQRNSYACSHQALVELLYAATVLEKAQKDYAQVPTAIPDALAELLQPNPRYFEMAVAYARLPEASRTALEAAFGTAPFDLSTALSRLPRP